MRILLQSLIRFVVRRFFSFVLVVGILAAGKWVLTEFEAFKSVSTDLRTLESAAKVVDAHRADLANDAMVRVTDLEARSVARLNARIDELNQSITAKASAQRTPLLSLPFPKGSEVASGVEAYFKRAVEIEFLTQERDYLTGLRRWIDAARDRDAAVKKLEQLWREHKRVYELLRENEQSQSKLKMTSPRMVRVPWTREHEELKALEQNHKVLFNQNESLYKAFLQQQATVNAIGVMTKPPSFKVNEERVGAAVRPLHNLIAQGTTFTSQNWIAKASGPVMEVVPIAASVVLMACLAPIAIKLLFYFVLAPLATRLKAISIVPDALGTIGLPYMTGPTRRDEPRSAVSQPVIIGKDDVMLIHSEYIQSSSVSAKTDTQWLLDWSFPLTSIAAGLVALTRIQPDGTETVVVSATDDPLSEIATLSLPEGAAMVFQPRSLVGVIYRRGSPLTITRHWRLGSLHAWLTLQLRYLVFRGPVTLIVRGCRGVKVEVACGGRRISQSATLGFSANVAYSTVRSETFFPYLTGKQALLHDRFEGPSGYYVYEETPTGGKRPGMFGRGLQGLSDAVLKVFGI